MNELDRFDPLSASNLGAYSFIEAGSGLSDVPAFPLDDLAPDDLAFLKIDVQSARSHRCEPKNPCTSGDENPKC